MEVLTRLSIDLSLCNCLHVFSLPLFSSLHNEENLLPPSPSNLGGLHISRLLPFYFLIKWKKQFSPFTFFFIATVLMIKPTKRVSNVSIISLLKLEVSCPEVAVYLVYLLMLLLWNMLQFVQRMCMWSKQGVVDLQYISARNWTMRSLGCEIEDHN